jgi:hypothetical protein
VKKFFQTLKSLKIMEQLDTLLPLLLVGIYVCFRWQIIPETNSHDYYFICTSIGLGYFIRRQSRQVSGILRYLPMILGSSFFYALAILFIWYWGVLGEKAIWVYKSLILSVIISGIVLTIKYWKNGIINRTFN